ncbi:hypothetical protein SLEP1_g18607 [Rubroshorea leprosula]|nr:hypothetical protein SLEP1_g18607 [Rubroshorea leprosula]
MQNCNPARNPVEVGTKLFKEGDEAHVNRTFFMQLVILTMTGVIELKYCKFEKQVADILTKPLKYEAFVKLKGMMGISALSNQD